MSGRKGDHPPESGTRGVNRLCDNRRVSVTTKILNPDDWPEWRSVRLDALSDAPAAFGSGLADWIDATDERWHSRIDDVPLNVIAALDNKLVGQVSAMSNDSAETIELISMWVSPTARGAGVGDALINVVTSWAASQGASIVELCVKASNVPARRLYERNEFLVDGAGVADDEIRMVRTLS
jgi:ribosomal protein S18 acetylase RimI-like enzyme